MTFTFGMRHTKEQSDRSASSQLELSRTIRDSRWLTLAKVLAAAMMFFQVVFLARTLGERDYGHWAMIVSCGFLLHRCCTPRTNEWLIRFLPQFRAAGDFQRIGRLLTLTVMAECLTAGVAFGLLWILAPPNCTRAIA